MINPLGPMNPLRPKFNTPRKVEPVEPIVETVLNSNDHREPESGADTSDGEKEDPRLTENYAEDLMEARRNVRKS